MECQVCHESRFIPIALPVNYIGINADDSILVNNPIHFMVCWRCGTVRVMDLDPLKVQAIENGKVISLRVT